MAHCFPISVLNKHHGAKGEYIGRGSPLGNPFKIEGQFTRSKVIELYETRLQQWIEDGNPVVLAELNRLAEIAMQRPLSLVCFCKPQACHGDIIKRVLCEAIAKHQE